MELKLVLTNALTINVSNISTRCTAWLTIVRTAVQNKHVDMHRINTIAWYSTETLRRTRKGYQEPVLWAWFEYVFDQLGT